MTTDKRQLIHDLLPLLKKCVDFALVFGSFQNENFADDDAIVVAVFLKSEISLDAEVVKKFRKKISTAFHHPVEITVLNNCDIVITMQVLGNGQLIINNNPSFFDLY